MSSAFVKEGDHQELSDIRPSLNALIVFLTSEMEGSGFTNEGISRVVTGELFTK